MTYSLLTACSRTDDPVTRQPDFLCLEPFVYLSNIVVEYIGDELDWEETDLPMLRAVLRTWYPRQLSRKLVLGIYVIASTSPVPRRTKREFLYLVDRIGQTVEESCAG